jgi:hypothetical protein
VPDEREEAGPGAGSGGGGSAGAGSPAERAACDELATKARAGIAAAHAAASKSCARDEDCAVVTTSVCPPGCEVAAVARTAESTLREAVVNAGRGPCTTWRDRDCLHVTGAPVPSCVPYAATCASGTCAARRAF